MKTSQPTLFTSSKKLSHWNWKILVVIFSIVTAIVISGIYYIALSQETITPLKALCEEKKGIWFEEYNECERSFNGEQLDSAMCTAVGGTFESCDSVAFCRHSTKIQACPEVCVQVCKAN